MENIWRDVRQSARSLGKTPGLSIAALACVAVGIAAAVFISTVTHGVLARRLPFPHSDRLVRVWKVDRTSGETRGGLSYLDFRDLAAAQPRTFEAVHITARTRLVVTTEEGAERTRGEAVSRGYFAMIGARPAMGRLFSNEEYLPSGDRVILISHDLWQRRYQGRPDIIGRTVRARGFNEGRESDELRTIIGVMPADFAGTIDADVSDFWIPVDHYSPRVILERRANRSCWIIGRLRRGATVEAAQAEIARIGHAIAAKHPDVWRNTTLRVELVGERWRSEYRTGLLMLTGASVLLLLITSTNIANLLLARLARREQELAVRVALGATRRRIVQQLLSESVLLSAAGGGAGVAMALLCLRLFSRANVLNLPRYATIAPDGRSIAAAVSLVFATGILFGVVPALLGSRAHPSPTLRETTRGGSQSRRQRLVAETLVMVEVALTVVLLIGAALMLRTWSALAQADHGFRTDHLLRMAITLDATAFGDEAAQLRFVERAREELSSHPGVENVTFLAGVLPPFEDHRMGVAVNGVAIDALQNVHAHFVDGRFFEVLGITLLRGRAFSRSHGAAAERAAVVSQRLAREIAGGDGSGALGRTIQTGDRTALSAPIEIVGIVSDVRYLGPLSERALDYDLYLPLAPQPDYLLSIGILTSVNPESLAQPLQQLLGRLAPTSPTHFISTMEEEMALQIRDARLYAWLSAIFGFSALVLAVLGVYGVLANSVDRRTNELGVRMALGAGPRDITRLVVHEGMAMLFAGIAAGVTLAIAATRLLRTLLHGLAPVDPVSYAAVVLVMVLCGVLASYIPARRAIRLEPVVALGR